MWEIHHDAMKNIHLYLANFLNSHLFINKQGLDSLLLFATKVQSSLLDRDDFNYSKESERVCKAFSLTGIPLTINYSNSELSDNSVAFYRIEGTIFADTDPWDYFFSTTKFIESLKQAEANPKIGAHFLYVYSGGGEAYKLDEATAVVASLKKPVVAITYKYNCSAAYHLSCAADRLYASNVFDTIGCIGTMMSGLDIIPYFEKMGLKYFEEYAEQSSEKNSRFRELRKGNAQPLIVDELNPLAQNFIDTVQKYRGITDEHVLAGQSYYANLCEPLRLIDGVVRLEDALTEVYDLAKAYAEESDKQEYALNHLI